MTTENATPPPLNGHVVVGYDGSEHAERALDRAAIEASNRGVTLEVVCSDPWPPPRMPDIGLGLMDEDYLASNIVAQEMLERGVERALKLVPGLAVVPTLTPEDPAEALLARGRDAALTVVGTRGHGGFAGLLLGSVSLRVAAHCEGPLLVVRGEADPDQEPRGTVLVGLQSDEDSEAVDFGFQEAQRRGARLRVLHAWAQPAPIGGMPTVDAERTRLYVEEGRRAAQAGAEDVVSRQRRAYPQVEVVVEQGSGPAGGALVEASRSADVVVLTAHRNRRRLGMQLGPVTHAVLHHAHCPVVVIPAP